MIKPYIVFLFPILFHVLLATGFHVLLYFRMTQTSECTYYTISSAGDLGILSYNFLYLRAYGYILFLACCAVVYLLRMTALAFVARSNGH